MADYSSISITVAILDQSNLCEGCAPVIFADCDEEEGTETISGEFAWGASDVLRSLQARNIPYHAIDDGCPGCWDAYEEVFDGKRAYECPRNLLQHMSPTGKLTKSMQKTVETFCRVKANFYKRAKRMVRKTRKGKARA